MMDLAGRTALVTGGAQGIGLGIARALAAEGVRLALADIDASALAAARAELSAATAVESVVLDVRDRDAWAAAADEVERRLGPVTLLCNNAGVGGTVSVAEMRYEMWDLVYRTNLGGVVNGIQTFLPRMLRLGGPAHIVNTASAAGLAPVGGMAGYMYEGSKAAVVGLTEALAGQLARERHPVGVSVLCPGPVASDMVEHSQAARVRAVGAGEPDTERRRLLDEQQAYLRLVGLPPDTIGTMVVEGIKAELLHIVSDRTMAAALAARAKALFSALPPETDHDRRISRGHAAQLRQGLRNAGTAGAADG
ncbi:SDR family oxidoreductase [Streptomycetaceae bacterium NBC_01309]